MNCQSMVFSPKHSQNRIEKALQVLPELVVKKILFFALYLLGARMNAISLLVDMPEESGKTTISRMLRDGIPALRDRRCSAKTYKPQLPPSSPQNSRVSVATEGDFCVITFVNSNQQLKISQRHRIHLKSVVLSLLQADLISPHAASTALGITVAHCRDLAEKLLHEGVTEVLVDKRKGQKHDLRVTSQMKAELVQQFAARSITGYSVSSQALTEIINDKQKTTISPRTIRWHMNKLGLTGIKRTLPKLIESLKKTTEDPC
jgi:transposase